MDIDLRLLRYFVVVAEELHFTRAAERLHMSQPALSNQIKRLEQRLHLVLFARNTRDVCLTDAGEALLPRAREAIASVSLGIAEARAGSYSTLRLDILDSALDTPRRILHHLRSLSPQLSVETTTLGTPSQHHHVLAGDLDVALGSDRGIPVGIDHEIIRRESVAVVMPESHPLAGLSEVSPSALSGDTHYLPRDDFAPGWNEFVRQICRDAGFEPRRHVVSTDGIETALDLVRHGECVAVCLSSTAARPGTVRRPLIAPHYAWAMMWRSTSRIPGKVQLALDAARNAAAEERWAG